MHELSHLILEHKPSRFDVSHNGAMILDNYDHKQEDEANWLAGALLVPRDPLCEILRNININQRAAENFEVSVDMIRCRRQSTGIDIQLKRAETG